MKTIQLVLSVLLVGISVLMIAIAVEHIHAQQDVNFYLFYLALGVIFLCVAGWVFGSRRML